VTAALPLAPCPPPARAASPGLGTAAPADASRGFHAKVQDSIQPSLTYCNLCLVLMLRLGYVGNAKTLEV